MAALTATAFPAQAQSTPENTQGICGRTQEVQESILALVKFIDSDVTRCEEVTDDHLGSESDCATHPLNGAALGVINRGLTNLKAGDFAGLTCLTQIHIGDNLDLTTLPAAIFSGLSNLTGLVITGNGLDTLPSTLLSPLNNLRSLDFGGNSITRLPASIFPNFHSLQILNLDSNSLTELPAGVFSDLSFLNRLDLYDNSITRLPTGIFESLSSLNHLRLDGNPITGLPEEVFSGLSGSGLNALYLPHETDNSGDFTLTLEWERVDGSGGEERATLKLKLRENTGAPFRMEIPVSVLGATASADSLQVPAGANESNELTVTSEAGSKGFRVTPQTPSFPNTCFPRERPCYRGFRPGQPAKIPTFAVGGESVCDRTPQVRDEILRLIPIADIACDKVLPSELAAVTNLNLQDKGISSLKPGDFDGFTGLTSLNLTGNNLNRLPAGIFAGLTSLDTLHLSSNRGADFRLTVRFSSSGLRKSFTTASVRVVLREGAPRPITVPIFATGATLSPDTLRIAAGSVRSDAVTVTRTSGGEAFELSQGELGFGGDHANYSGFEIVPGPAVTTASFTHVRARVFLEGALE